jgi:hypothetical protein
MTCGPTVVGTLGSPTLNVPLGLTRNSLVVQPTPSVASWTFLRGVKLEPSTWTEPPGSMVEGVSTSAGITAPAPAAGNG